jgi:large subunit ribosomal protein L10
MVATWKKDTVDKIAKDLKSHKVVGVVSIKSIPSKQLQNMKKKLKGQVGIAVARSNLIKRALAKAGVKDMDGYVNGPSGIVFSNLSAFQMEKAIYGCKTKAPAKAGSIAPFDLIVPAGDTGLAAGPVIGDLQGAGVKAKIQGGKITVTEDSLLVKQGQVVNDKVSAVLSRLGVEPMEIILRVNAASEAGMVYPGDVLHIDEEETRAKIADAHRKAFNLAYHTEYFTKDNVPLFIQEAICKTRNLMINAKIVNKETVGIYLARADAAAKSLASVLPPELQSDSETK